MGVVREVSVSRASRTLLVYTSACAWAEINLGTALGDHRGFVMFTISERSIQTREISQTYVLLISYLASFTIHTC